MTDFINRRIFEAIALQPSDYLVDIGCGDGFFLRLALESRVRAAVGITPSEYEASCLREHGLDVRAGTADAVPLSDAVATVVVCNSVLLLVPESQIAKSLSEIARISVPSARVFIGEVPFVREPDAYPRHETVSQMLWWVLRNRGLRSFLGICRRLVIGAQRGPELRHPTQAIFFSPPDEFIRRAAEVGLRMTRNETHVTLSANQQPYLSPTRWDYLFTKD
ncbi:MAG: methyltransferase domain-containing protein [Steroidobacteraceae bacterium]